MFILFYLWCREELIKIPSTVEKIEYDAFQYCNSLRVIYVDSIAVLRHQFLLDDLKSLERIVTKDGTYNKQLQLR